MNKEDERPRNKFVHCVCGVTYISGYTHCPSCGRVNPNDNKSNPEKHTHQSGV